MARADGPDIGNLIWVIFVAVMLIASALRKVFSKGEAPAPEPPDEPPPTEKAPKPAQGDDFRRFLEEVLGVKVETPPAPVPEAKPPKRKRRPQVPVAAPVAEAPKPRAPQPSDIFQSTTATRESYAAGPSLALGPSVTLDELLPKNPLQRAIVVAEIFGPPLSQRRTHRLF